MKYDGNVFFIGDFDEAMEDEIIVPLTREIQRQRLEADPHIDLYINSVGGNLYLLQHLVELVEQAKQSDVMVRTMVMSMAFSAGSLLAITGDQRYIARSAEHMIHYGSGGYASASPKQIQVHGDRLHREFKWGYNHYKKYANIPKLKNKMANDNYYITADKCIEWGLADFYMDELDIGYLSA